MLELLHTLWCKTLLLVRMLTVLCHALLLLLNELLLTLLWKTLRLPLLLRLL
jgi:hypothetical protein